MVDNEELLYQIEKACINYFRPLLNGHGKGGSDKIRIKKYQHQKVEQWCEVLGIPDSRFVEDAINFYLQYLEGRQPTAPPVIQFLSSDPSTAPPVIQFLSSDPSQETVEPIDTEDPDEYQGGISL